MRSPPPGLLAAWLKVPAAADEEFNDWYNTEHLQQIASNPGFLNGRRYRSLDSDWYVALYDLESPAACLDGPFRDVIAQPTPWSRRIAKLYGPNRVRNIYRLILSLGPPLVAPAPCVFIAQMNVPAHVEPEFHSWYNEEHAPALAAVPGCLRVRRFEAVEGGPKFMAIYELASPEVLDGDAWLAARELGRTVRMREYMTDVQKATYRFLHQFVPAPATSP